MFRNDIPLNQKRITAEACIHHLWFDESSYDEKGTLIKWNPAVKSAKDKEGVWKALIDDRIDIIATDHAPILLMKKTTHILKRHLVAFSATCLGGHARVLSSRKSES